MNRAHLIVATAILCLSAQAQNPTANLTVDVNANRRPINPNVYGVAFATTTQLQDLNVKLHRYGGNNTSRYNWQINADNRGQDWYFESIGDTSSTAGERGDTFISTSRAGGAEPMLTIPIINWVAKIGSLFAKLRPSQPPAPPGYFLPKDTGCRRPQPSDLPDSGATAREVWAYR